MPSIHLSFPPIGEEFTAYKEAANMANRLLDNRQGKGADFLGWLVPTMIWEEIDEIQFTAEQLRKKNDCIVIIGIGGSYLGSKAVIEVFKTPFSTHSKGNPEILYAGHQLSSHYLAHLQTYLSGKDFSIIYISKSGTTLEPAIAFLLLKALLIKKYGETEAMNHIIAITDPQSGALRNFVKNNQIQSYSVPQDIGGRYSVLTAVGLLPIACSGIDIKKIVIGAQKMCETISANNPSNIAELYAAFRIMQYQSGKKIELLSTFHPQLEYLQEWWKQLFAESEGKEGTSLFPAKAIFSTDLHSIGQWIQEGPRNLFETFISIKNTHPSINIPHDPDAFDGLATIEDMTLKEIEQSAEKGTIEAHQGGNVPCLSIEIENLDEVTLGALLFFFEKSAAISGYLLGINPFDQPGVEMYKTCMNKLLISRSRTQSTKIK